MGEFHATILVEKDKNQGKEGPTVKKRISYRVRNWGEYNQALINRGKLTFWVSENVLKSWYAPLSPKPTQGRPFVYSDLCIETILTLRSLFHFPLRATQGFIEDLASLIGLNTLKIPHYTSLSRRAGNLKINISHKARTQGATDLAIDSTGLKIYGEGEWKMRTHGKNKRRTWRKFHVAMNPHDKQGVRVELTKATVHDDQMASPLLRGLKGINNVYADGAYISENCFNAIVEVGARAKIPLRTGTSLAKVRDGPDLDLALKERNRLVRDIWDNRGRLEWKKNTDYHTRSLVENYMYRFKTIFGGKLSGRKFKNQQVEAKIKARALNLMTQLGMPDSYPVA